MSTGLNLYDDPRFRWLLTDSYAGRVCTPVLLLEETSMRCARVQFLSAISVNGRRYPSGHVKRVPQNALTANVSSIGRRVPIEEDHARFGHWLDVRASELAEDAS